MLTFIGRNRREQEAAAQILGACTRAARRPEFFWEYGLPDTLQGRFEAMTLHLFPVLHRLMHDPGDGADLARVVTEQFVADTDAGLRELGIADTAVPKRMREVYRSFAGRIEAYTQSLGSIPALAAAIGRNLYPDHPDETRTMALAEYLRVTSNGIRAVPLTKLRLGQVPFPDIVTAGPKEPSP